MEQRYRHRLGLARFQFGNDRVNCIGLQRPYHFSLVIQPFGNFETPVHWGLGLDLGWQIETVEVQAVLAADRQAVGKPFGRDQRHLGQVILDDGIGDHGGAVNQVGHIGPG
jgi:hypothetical protein